MLKITLKNIEITPEGKTQRVSRVKRSMKSVNLKYKKKRVKPINGNVIHKVLRNIIVVST